MAYKVASQKLESGWLAFWVDAPYIQAGGHDQETAVKNLGPRIVHTEKSLNFYANFLKKDDLCFDVGANHGNRSMIFAMLGARVIAIEPQPKCLKSLESMCSTFPQIQIIETALGEVEGTGEIMLSNFDTVSSMSTEWMEDVKNSGRFASIDWKSKIPVKISSLDKLIEKHGVPAFVKIDVEGFEREVLKGLSQKVGALSFEFIVERLADASECMRILTNIGKVEFNVSLGESMVFSLQRWFSFEERDLVFDQLSVDKLDWGDIYARFV